MRMLDDNEKKIIDEILNLNSPEFIGNLIDPLASNMRITIPTSENEIINIEYGIKGNKETKEESDQAKTAIGSLCDKLIIVLNLLRILENEGYIILYRLAKRTSGTTTPVPTELGNLPSGSNTILMHFPDNTFSNLLIDIWDKRIFITPELKRFKEKGYISRDEQKFITQRQISLFSLSIATCSLIIAIIALVVTTYFNLKKVNSPVKIDNNQFEQISSKVNQLETQFVEINKNLNKPVIYSVHDSILLNKITFELRNIKPILTKSK